jgi:alpha-tubulin suppressor-like RCC1 family protein
MLSMGAMRVRQNFLGRSAIPVVLFSIAALMVSGAARGASAVFQGVSLIKAGGEQTCAIEGGKAYCWGDNRLGDLGDGTTVSSGVPVAVASGGVLAGKTITQIASGDDADACALDSAGTAYCWGNNNRGQLGDGSTGGSSAVPVAVNAAGALAGKKLTAITVGYGYACALDSAGAAYCWGDNRLGELGDGTSNSASVPVAVDTSGLPGGGAFTQITAAFTHTCALAATGAAYCWGDNRFGELGDGSAAGSARPVAVDSAGALAGKTITQIAAAGTFHTCALDSAGAAFCWGLNDFGQLGIGPRASSSVPAPVYTGGVLAGKTLTQLAAGHGNNTCALDSAGAAFCWGPNESGQLGDGTGTGSNVPAAVSTSGVLAGKVLIGISAGYEHTCALSVAGTAYCWGADHYGQIGDDGGDSPVPSLVGLDAPVGVTAATGHDAATIFWRAPPSLNGSTLTGYTVTVSPGGSACTTVSVTTCTIGGLTDGTTYSVSVVAHTTFGDSGPSAPWPVTVTHGPVGQIVSGYQMSKCVEDNDNSTANDAKIVISDCTADAGQEWTIEGDGSIQINGKCLDIYREENANNAPVELWTCTGRANQQWQMLNGTLVNPGSRKCLNDPGFNVTDGTQLDIYTCDGGANQQWSLP